jgi:hypothetical protein
MLTTQLLSNGNFVKRHSRILSVAAATAIGAFVGATPALAASYVPGTAIFIGSDSNYWSWHDGGDLSLAGHKTDSWHNNVSTDNTWDGTHAMFLNRDLTTSTSVFCANSAYLTPSRNRDSVQSPKSGKNRSAL